MKVYNIKIREFPENPRQRRYSIQIRNVVRGWYPRTEILKMINEELKKALNLK